MENRLELGSLHWPVVVCPQPERHSSNQRRAAPQRDSSMSLPATGHFKCTAVLWKRASSACRVSKQVVVEKRKEGVFHGHPTKKEGHGWSNITAGVRKRQCFRVVSREVQGGRSRVKRNLDLNSVTRSSWKVSFRLAVYRLNITLDLHNSIKIGCACQDVQDSRGNANANSFRLFASRAPSQVWSSALWTCQNHSGRTRRRCCLST